MTKMSNANTSTTDGVLEYERETEQPKQRVTYQQALGQLEKQHRLAKLQTELAEFRVREVQANMYYLELVRKHNSPQETPQAQTPPEGPVDNPENQDENESSDTE